MAGNAKKVGRHKRTLLNVAYKAQDRLSHNKRINVAKAAARRKANHGRVEWIKVIRGTARKTRRNAARAEWLVQDNTSPLPLSAFCI